MNKTLSSNDTKLKINALKEFLEVPEVLRLNGVENF